jgi:heptosyltransferase-3
MESVKSLWRRLCGWCFSPPIIGIFFRRRREEFAWGNVRRILVVKLDGLGDYVLATPFLRELRRSAPEAEITLVVRPCVINLAETCPHVNRVLAYDGRTEGLRFRELRRQWRAWRLARREFRRRRPDVAVLPRWGEDAYNATHLALYSNARGIVAYTERATRVKAAMNLGFDALVTHVVPAGAGAHEIEHNLGLIRCFGGTVASSDLEIWPTEQDARRAAELLPRGGRFAAFGTGALDPARRWPIERFAAIAEWLRSEHGFTPVVLGVENDATLAGAVDIRGMTTPREAAAAAGRCALFVGNDSGLKHLAAAMRVPVVEISGFPAGGDPNHGNSPARFHAWGAPHRVVQPRAAEGGELNIGGVSIEDVQAAVREVLSES